MPEFSADWKALKRLSDDALKHGKERQHPSSQRFIKSEWTGENGEAVHLVKTRGLGRDALFRTLTIHAGLEGDRQQVAQMSFVPPARTLFKKEGVVDLNGDMALQYGHILASEPAPLDGADYAKLITELERGASGEHKREQSDA